MSQLVDFHIHSDRSSDGSFSPCRLIELAKEHGFRAIAISDHDTLGAYPEALECGQRAGIEVIPSIELTTLFDGREFHLLLPFVHWEGKIIRKIIVQECASRMKEAQERVAKLQENGFDITWAEVEENTKSVPPLGVTLAQVLLDKESSGENIALKKYLEGSNRTYGPYLFYRDYFMEGKPAFVPKRHIQLTEVLDLAPQTGGVPVLAHPGAYFEQATREDLVLLRERGLRGLEVYTSYHSHDKVNFYRELAEDLGLVPTAGSDFHGAIKPHIPFGFIRSGEYWMVERLRKQKEGYELQLA